MAWVMSAVEGEDQLARAHIELDVDVGGGTRSATTGLAHDRGQLLRLRHGLGHAREGGELVHHAADVAHLPDDGVRALVEDLAIVGLIWACRICA
jgi:hypothetical protein